MLSIKEVGGIAGVKGKRLESGKGSESRRRPFPAIAEHAGNAEGTLGLPRRTDRHWVPALKIEISRHCGFSFAIGRAECRALPLGFARQRLARPPCIR